MAISALLKGTRFPLQESASSFSGTGSVADTPRVAALGISTLLAQQVATDTASIRALEDTALSFIELGECGQYGMRGDEEVCTKAMERDERDVIGIILNAAYRDHGLEPEKNIDWRESRSKVSKWRIWLKSFELQRLGEIIAQRDDRTVFPDNRSKELRNIAWKFLQEEVREKRVRVFNKRNYFLSI